MTVATVRAELVTKLKTVDPLSGRSYGYVPDSFQAPGAFVGTLTHDPRAAMGGIADLTAQVWVGVSASAASGRAVDSLDAYTQGATYDVAAALQATSTAWDDLVVTGSEWPVFETIGGGSYAFIRFDVDIYLD